MSGNGGGRIGEWTMVIGCGRRRAGAQTVTHGRGGLNCAMCSTLRLQMRRLVVTVRAGLARHGGKPSAASFEQVVETSEARPGVDGYPFSDMRRVSIEYLGSGES